MPAFGEEHGSRAQGGFALSCFALGSLIGGIWIGTRPPARRLAMRFMLALAALALALLPPLVAPSIPVMCVLMLIAGLPIAPAFAASYGLWTSSPCRERRPRPSPGSALPSSPASSLGTSVERRRDRAVRPDRRARAGRALRRRGGARGVRAPGLAGDPRRRYRDADVDRRVPSRRHRRERQGRLDDRRHARARGRAADPVRARRRARARAAGRRGGRGRLPRPRLGARRAAPRRSRVHGQRARGRRGPHRGAPSFVDAAAGVGVGLLAYLSIVNPSPTAAFHHGRSHCRDRAACSSRAGCRTRSCA